MIILSWSFQYRQFKSGAGKWLLPLVPRSDLRLKLIKGIIVCETIKPATAYVVINF